MTHTLATAIMFMCCLPLALSYIWSAAKGGYPYNV